VGQPTVSRPNAVPLWLRRCVNGYVVLFVYGFLGHVGQITRDDYRACCFLAGQQLGGRCHDAQGSGVGNTVEV
jgi:hypothetical protein